MVKKQENSKKKPVSYRAKVGCWNCDLVYDIAIKKGINTPEHLIKKEPLCRNCGCNSLKMFNEYKTEKKIMKDLILHHRIESMGAEQNPEKTDKESDQEQEDADDQTEQGQDRQGQESEQDLDGIDEGVEQEQVALLLEGLGGLEREDSR